MSTLRVNKLTNRLNTAGPQFTQGATVPSGKTITGDGSINTAGSVTSNDISVTGNVTANGTITAATFSGTGVNLTNVPGTKVGKAVALTIIS
tara:strand:+ start:178 stop:453 length:276 start_codon:yes stop_codon:yes gene_type:complete